MIFFNFLLLTANAFRLLCLMNNCSRYYAMYATYIPCYKLKLINIYIKYCCIRYNVDDIRDIEEIFAKISLFNFSK